MRKESLATSKLGGQLRGEQAIIIAHDKKQMVQNHTEAKRLNGIESYITEP
jgi:hypothetical protein